jgi:hypothetical protein
MEVKAMRAGVAQGTFGKEGEPSDVLKSATYRPVPSGADIRGLGGGPQCHREMSKRMMRTPSQG